MTQQMNQHPDYIVIKQTPNVDIGDMNGEWLDLQKVSYLSIALELYGCKMVPTPDLEFSAQGEVAQVFEIVKIES